MNCFAIIPSAGSGKRMRSSLPKQFIKINNKEILIYTLEKFVQSNLINKIFIPTSVEYFDFTRKLIEHYNFNKEIEIIRGGQERQHSVYNALTEIPAKDNDLICIHDAARPFITLNELENSIKFAIKHKSIVVAQKARDTIKTGAEFVEKTLDRNKIWIVQTPQIFCFSDIIFAYQNAFNDNFLGTDDASLMERINHRVYFYDVQSENRKITTQLDLNFAELVLKDINVI